MSEPRKYKTTLTPKQERFVAEYLSTGNATEAYRRAYNYSKMKPASVNRKAKECLDNVNISARIKELRDKSESALVMSRQEALERLTGIGRACLSDLVEFGSYEVGEVDGDPVVQATWRFKDSALLDKDKLASIAELNAGRDGFKIKMHSPLQAVQQIAKMQGWEQQEEKPDDMACVLSKLIDKLPS
jgi:phage terminase small subunit